MTTLYYVIATLIVLMTGMACSFVWFVRCEARDRRKHYKITLAIAPDGSLSIHESKLTERGREALVVVPYSDTLLADIDIRLSDGKATVTDLRIERIKCD